MFFADIAGLTDGNTFLLVCAGTISAASLLYARYWHQKVTYWRSRLSELIVSSGETTLSQTQSVRLVDKVRRGKSLEQIVPSLQTTLEKLRWTVSHDPLTGLYNASGFRTECERQDTRAGTLLFCDINGFKEVNDLLGHGVGDRFLAVIADRLRIACASPLVDRILLAASLELEVELKPIVGRLGGDEFAIFLPGIEGEQPTQQFIQLLFRLLDEPIQIGLHSLAASMSIGVALESANHGAFDRLLSSADTAMYEAKAESGNAVRFYEPQMRQKADLLLQRELELRNAIRGGQLRLHFQPQLDLQSGTISGAEALVRWEHPRDGLIPPDTFIPFAENFGLIAELGEWVLDDAVKRAAKWNANGRAIKVAVNVSPSQLAADDFVSNLRACLSCHGLPPHLLEIEFTEQTAMAIDEVTLARLDSLRAEGVTIALDDFGTGYSNLAELLVAPIDRIKLDRCLLTAADTSQKGRLVMMSAVRLARQMSIEVVAEGVETDRQMQILRRVNCHVAQGFLIGRPMAEEDLLVLHDAYPQSLRNGSILCEQ